MKKKIFVIFLPIFLLVIFPTVIFARSSYVLPYPGVMPGNKLYVISELIDEFKKYYYFGDFAQFSYYLSMSDKKLVEAKTLFEYNQYPLALKALEKADLNFAKAKKSFNSAKQHKKNTIGKQNIFKEAYGKHIEILEDIKKTVPEKFIWQDENKKPVTLYLHESIKESLTKHKQAYE